MVKGVKSNADVVVTLEAPGLKLAPPAEPLKIDQKGFRFLPHVSVVQTGSSIRFLNNDPEPHNVYSPEGRYNLGTWPTGDTKDYTFKKPGIYSQLCNIHPDMLAYVVVVDTPLLRPHRRDRRLPHPQRAAREVQARRLAREEGRPRAGRRGASPASR